MTPSTEAKKVAAEIASEFGIPYSVLDAIIKNESGWNPTIKNPTSSARGLIQFIDATAQTLGFANSADLVAKYPDQVSQLRGPVRSYFQMYAPFKSEDEFIASVFYPAYRRTPERVLPDSVQKANPGVVTMGDYIARVRRRLGLPVASLVPLFLLFGAGALWWYSRSGR